MDTQSNKSRLRDQLRRGYQRRRDWVAGLSDAERNEVGTPERWSAKDYIIPFAEKLAGRKSHA